jgi:hypothetical protein
MVWALRKTSGSCRASQSALGIIHSADTGPQPSPLIARAGSPVASTASASAPARTSIQRIAGRSGRAASSRATTVQQVVVAQSAAMAWAPTPASSTARRTTMPSDAHQASGSCSARAPAENWVG